MRRRLALFFGSLAILISAHGSAGAADADELVGRGIALRKERHDAEALALFRQAYALQPAPRTRAQIGLAELALGKFIEAESDLKGALDAAADPWIAKNADALHAALSTVEDHLAWVTVTTTAGTEVRVDGRLIGTAPLEQSVRVVAGTVHVEVARHGELPSRREIDVAPRQTVAVTVDAPAPKISAPAPAPVIVPPKTPALTYIGAGLVGFGVAAIGVGSYFGVRAIQQKHLRDEHCDPKCDEDAIVADRRTRDAMTFSTIGFVTGAVTTLAGVVLLRVGRTSVTATTTGSSGRVMLFGEF